MSNTEFNATNGEQNSVQTLTSDNVAQENAVQSEPQKPLKLSEFLQSSDGKGLSQNDKGQFVPDNKQIKNLVNCIDESTGELISLAKIDTSKVTSMKELFRKSERKDFSGIEKWDTSGVSTFASMFESVECFNSDISGWNVENAKSFYFMFWNASSFNQPIGAKWNTKSAEGMIGMFCQARNFNNGGQPFGEKWLMDKVKWTWRMFWGAENFNQEINHWNVANVENMQRMFMNAKAFNKPLSKWNVSNVKNMEEMFNGAESFNQDLSAWGDKLGNAQTTKRMFAATKVLTIDFLGAWKIPENCNTDNITKGSALESKDKSKIKVIATSNGIKENVFDKCQISQIEVREKNKIQSLNLRENKEILGEWIPQNILESDYKVFLAKINDKVKENSGEEKFSLSDLEQGHYDEWDFAFYKVFDCWFLVEKNDKKLSDIQKCVGNSFEIEQSTEAKTLSWEDEDINKAHTYDNNLSILFSSQYISILAKNTAKSKNILAVLNAYILAKAYNTEMQELGNIARKANEKRRKNKESVSFWDKMPFSKARKTNKALYKELKKSYEFVCNFDLHSYHNIPITQTKLDDTSLVEIWQQMSKTYMIQDKHDELKETIGQITELVSNERQEELNFIMRWVAFLSAIAAVFAAVPVFKDLALWIASKF